MVGAVEYANCISEEPSNECPDMTLNHLEVQAPVLELWGMWSTSSFPLLSGSLKPRVVVPIRVPSMGQIELFNHLLEAI